MRRINYIIIHCTATPEDHDIGVEVIDRWHKQLGWRKCGYHYVVRLDGSIERGRPDEEEGAHCSGHNYDSIGVAYVGGLKSAFDKDGALTCADTRTFDQKRALKDLVGQLKDKYPDAVVLGHHDFNPHKACPCFDAQLEYC